MRIIVLGSELIGLSTAYHLSKIGYEVIVVKEYASAGKEKHLFHKSEESDLIEKKLEGEMRRSKVQFLYGEKIEGFLKNNKRVRGIKLNVKGKVEIVMADYFVVASCAYKNNNIFKCLGAIPLISYKMKKFHNSFIGSIFYSNIYTAHVNKCLNYDSAYQCGKLLADYIYNPCELIANYSKNILNCPSHGAWRSFFSLV